MRYVFCTIFFVAIIGTKAQTIDNYRKALSILEKSRRAMGIITGSLVVSYKGTIHNLGHYEIPEITKDLPLEEKYGYFANENVSYLFSELQNRGNTYKRAAVSKIDSLYDFGYYNKSFSKGSSQSFVFEIAKAMPTELLRLAYENRKSLRYLGEQSLYYLLSFSYAGNQNATLYIEQQTHLLDKVETLGYSPIYGDVAFETVYKNFSEINGLKIPTTRMDYEFGQLERELNFTDTLFNIKPDTNVLRIKWVPKYFRKKLTDTAEASEQFEFSNISPSIDLIKIISQDNKLLVAKFADYIDLFEVPKGIALNFQLIAELEKRYPGKPLRYLFVTHHHPDHAGGIRAYAKLPVTLITTQGNKEYFEKLLLAIHSIGNNELADEPVQMKMEFVLLNGSKDFKDKVNEVVAYEIGSHSSHTREHIIYYFPKSKILWTGDLVFFDQKETIYSAGSRGKSVLDLIQTKKLSVDRIYTSWPLHGQKDYGTIDFLKKLVVSD